MEAEEIEKILFEHLKVENWHKTGLDISGTYAAAAAIASAVGEEIASLQAQVAEMADALKALIACHYGEWDVTVGLSSFPPETFLARAMGRKADQWESAWAQARKALAAAPKRNVLWRGEATDMGSGPGEERLEGDGVYLWIGRSFLERDEQTVTVTVEAKDE